MTFLRQLLYALARTPMPVESPEQAALKAVRQLCREYTPVPPPLLRGPGLSEHGAGFNTGTRTLADAVLATIDDAMGGQR